MRRPGTVDACDGQYAAEPPFPGLDRSALVFLPTGASPREGGNARSVRRLVRVDTQGGEQSAVGVPGEPPTAGTAPLTDTGRWVFSPINRVWDIVVGF
ncbi:hypothetical protein [Streptomyces sulphureus]|uniref:hypothetical protein n=1 Tax=Streptomyces sulphureus TaxID=47758 RepID=UPI00037DBF38|nr:hypothetical protein [Streptomyces sulphureus]